MRSANGLRALSNIFMQSPQVILLRSFCIATFYRGVQVLQVDLRIPSSKLVSEFFYTDQRACGHNLALISNFFV